VKLVAGHHFEQGSTNAEHFWDRFVGEAGISAPGSTCGRACLCNARAVSVRAAAAAVLAGAAAIGWVSGSNPHRSRIQLRRRPMHCCLHRLSSRVCVIPYGGSCQNSDVPYRRRCSVGAAPFAVGVKATLKGECTNDAQTCASLPTGTFRNHPPPGQFTILFRLTAVRFNQSRVKLWSTRIRGGAGRPFTRGFSGMKGPLRGVYDRSAPLARWLLGLSDAE
jgi:hypothetical protein